jgi:uncharacterized membrane protein
MEHLEAAVLSIINAVGIVIDALGVFVILVGIAIATVHFLRSPVGIAVRYKDYRIQMGRSLLLGLEILVAADIIRTVALGLNFASLGALGLLVLIRTFLSWTLTLEVDGHWPWQPAPEKDQTG